MMRALVIITALAGTAQAAKVTEVTPTTVYIDAGTADGLRTGATWQATIAGHQATIHVVAAATHDAVLQIDGATLAIGAQLDLPPGTAPPPPVALRPPPAAAPPWHPVPDALAQVQASAEHQQPPVAEPDHVMVTGELALSAFVAGDLSNDSTSWNDLALASQLSVLDGPWRYDHLLEAHLSGSSELFTAPWMHIKPRFDVYLLRLQYLDPRWNASIGRLSGAPLVELGTVDGARGSARLGHGADVTVFAGTRPAPDLGVQLVPTAGVDVGWQTATTSGTRARVDAGLAADAYKGALDRLSLATSATVSTTTLVLSGNSVVDLTDDAAGKAARVTYANGMVQYRRGRLTTGLSGGYDRPFIDRAYLAELPDLPIGPRTFVGGEGGYALSRDITLSSTVRFATGSGFNSVYGDVQGAWTTSSLHVIVAPEANVGSLISQAGLRGGVWFPWWRGSMDLLGEAGRVWANDDGTWAGLARTAYSLPFLERWRSMVSFEAAAGDGPVRLLVFALLGYRL